MYILEQLAFAAVFGWRLERRRMSGGRKAAVCAILAQIGILGAFTIWGPEYMSSLEFSGSREAVMILGAAVFCSVLFAAIAGLLYLFCEISVYEAIYTMT